MRPETSTTATYDRLVTFEPLIHYSPSVNHKSRQVVKSSKHQSRCRMSYSIERCLVSSSHVDRFMGIFSASYAVIICSHLSLTRQNPGDGMS
jgi:hypothetical protein